MQMKDSLVQWLAQWQTLNPQDRLSRLLLNSISAKASVLLERQFRCRLAAGCHQDIPDLVNRALEVMVHKLATYDPNKGTFQGWLFSCCMQPVFREHLRSLRYQMVSLPRYIALLEARYHGQPIQRNAWVQTLSRQEAATELARVLPLLAGGQRFISLRKTLPHLPAEPETQLKLIPSHQARLLSELKRLPPREQVVIRQVFFQGLPQTEIAQALNLTPARINQLKKQALQRLQRALGKTFFEECLVEN
jgi:RNA polymerase sigma factor (sigma-70 family)